MSLKRKLATGPNLDILILVLTKLDLGFYVLLWHISCRRADEFANNNEFVITVDWKLPITILPQHTVWIQALEC